MTSMSRRAVTGAVAAAMRALPAAAASWDMPTPDGDSPVHTRNIQSRAEDVPETTDDELEITGHPAGPLFAHPEIKGSVRRGFAPIGEVLMSRPAIDDAIFGVDSIPFPAFGYDGAQAL